MAARHPVDEVARATIEVALEFYRARVWSRVASDDPFLVRLPGDEHPSIANVLGSEGQELGLSLVHGEHAVVTYERWVRSPRGWRPDAPAPMSLLTFEPMHRVEPQLLRHVASARTPFAAHAAVPLFLHVEPGRPGRLMNRTEMRALAKAIQLVLEADSQGALAPRPFDGERRLLELTPEGPGRKARVLARVVTVPEPDFVESGAAWVPAPAVPPPVTRSRPRNRAEWSLVDLQLTSHLLARFKDGGKAVFERSLVRYFGERAPAADLMASAEGEDIRPIFLHWCLFHSRPRRGAMTLAEHYASDGAADVVEAEALTQRMAARPMFVRVLAVEPGASLEVEELSTCARYRLLDVALSKTAVVGLGVFLALYHIDGHPFIDLLGPPVLPSDLEATRERLGRHGLEVRDGGLFGDLSVLGRMFLDMPPASGRSLQNTDGDPVEQLVVRFAVRPRFALDAALEALPNIGRKGDGSWTWLVPRPDLPGFERGVVLAHFRRVGDELQARVNSRQRAERVLAYLAGVEGLAPLGVGEPAPPEVGGGAHGT